MVKSEYVLMPGYSFSDIASRSQMGFASDRTEHYLDLVVGLGMLSC